MLQTAKNVVQLERNTIMKQGSVVAVDMVSTNQKKDLSPVKCVALEKLPEQQKLFPLRNVGMNVVVVCS